MHSHIAPHPSLTETLPIWFSSVGCVKHIVTLDQKIIAVCGALRYPKRTLLLELSKLFSPAIVRSVRVIHTPYLRNFFEPVLNTLRDILKMFYLYIFFTTKYHEDYRQEACSVFSRVKYRA